MHSAFNIIFNLYSPIQITCTRSRLQRVRLQRATGYYEQIVHCTTSLIDYNVKKVQLQQAPDYYELNFVHQTARCKPSVMFHHK